MKSKRTRSIEASSQSPQHPTKKLMKTSSSESVKASKTKNSSTSLERYSSQNSSIKDVGHFQNSCSELLTLFEQTKALKDKEISPDATEMQELQAQCLLSFVKLKRCNRSVQLLNKNAKDKTQEAKQEVDGLHLQLQNLLYEIMHLKKEINKCLQFKSKDEELDLVSEDDFLKQGSKNKDIDAGDSHKLMLARLDWELSERMSLTTKKQDYLETKKKLTEEIESKNKFLKSLKPELDSVLKATKPIQDILEITLDAKREQYQTAKFLPRPLYTLFVQSSAYHEACDSEMRVSIIGDLEAAKAAIETKQGVVDIEFNDKTEEEEPEELPKKRHHRRATDEVRQEEKCKAALKKHPLKVQLDLSCGDEANVVLLFSYMQILDIVTVTVEVNLLKESTAPTFSGRSLLCPNSILTCLFPEDFGTKTPNPANHYLLSSLGIQDFSSHVSNIGHPYYWVQKVCGLNFPTDSNNAEVVTVDSSVSVSNMELTIKAIKARILTRVSLQQQLRSLELLTIQETKGSALLFPVKCLCKLESWTPLTLSDFLELSFVDDSTPELENVNENDMLFVATFSNEKVKLRAAVIVLSDYPIRPPLFILALVNGESYIRDDYIKALEREVNVFYEEIFHADNSKDNVLSNQLRRVQMCFDIYNDTNASNHSDRPNHEFLILRTKRGRDRGLALKYDSTHGCFTHRCNDMNFTSSIKN